METTMLKILCLLGLGLLWLPVAADPLPDTIDRVRPSVVAVGTLVSGRVRLKKPLAVYRGTGFVVGDGTLVVTNHHVVNHPLDTEKGERLAVFSGRGRQGRSHGARILRSDPEHDLALLRIDGGPLPALKLHRGRVREGRAVALTGFPIGMVLGLYPATHRGILAAIVPAAIPAPAGQKLTAARLRRLKHPFEIYQLDAVAYPGNSGSPVYLPENGEVVGVINSVFVKGSKEDALRHPSGISYAIPVRWVRRLLEEQP